MGYDQQVVLFALQLKDDWLKANSDVVVGLWIRLAGHLEQAIRHTSALGKR